LKPGSDNGEFSGSVSVNSNIGTGSIGGPTYYTLIKPYSTVITSQSFKVTVPARSTLYIVVENKK
jgi:hypothetical protein